jgi:hypothetical protein
MSSMQEQNTLRLTFTSWEKELQKTTWHTVRFLDEVADGFTKPLPSRELEEFKRNLNLYQFWLRGMLELVASY